MRHWSQLATRNWRVRQIRSIGAVAAIMLGTATIVWVSCCYESVRRTVMAWAGGYVGRSHITVQSPLGKYDQIPARLLEAVAAVNGVEAVNGLLVQRLHALTVRRDELAERNSQTLKWKPDIPEVDLHGIDLATEGTVRDHAASLLAGRMLAPGDSMVCLLDASYAEEMGVGLGDRLFVWGGSRDEPYELEIVGLIARRRVARFQKALALTKLEDLQRINSKFGLITSIDIVLNEAARKDIGRATVRVRAAVRRIVPNATIRNVEGRMQQIQFAQRQQEMVITLMSCVVLLTALITILSTLSMGMIERIHELGLMRCVGVTGGQLAWLMLLEVMPLGLVGVGAGIPFGLGMTALTVQLVPEYVGQFALNPRGILMAGLAGLLTTLVAALVPITAAVSVSPMEAARPRARRPHPLLLLGVLLLAALTLSVQHFGLMGRIQRSMEFFQWASAAIVLLYIGYSLVAPLVIRVVSWPVVAAVAAALRLRVRLLSEQVGHAVWRSSGIASGLMVGLSLIVEIMVVNESIVRGWQFPQQFPEAYVWSFEQMRPDAAEVIQEIEGVGACTAANAINVIIQERPPMLMDKVLQSVTWFMGCDPDTFFDLVRVEMVEGTLEEARELLKQGGHVVVADDFARSRNKHKGDEIKVYLGSRVRVFKVAAVMQSPALDIAAGYFQAQGEFSVVASGSVLGSNADLRDKFGFDGVKMLLLNFELPPEPPPPDWPPARSSTGADGLADYVYDASLPLERRWQAAREAAVLREIRERLNAPQAFAGTARELKDEIDRELTRITRLLAAIPGVALVVAALGVANLMAANVTARSRELAILRAVGATRGQVLRLVIGEALVLGMLGTALGLVLGLHLSTNVITLVDRMWGFRVELQLPWALLGVAVSLTVGLCLLAGVLPARHAARTNIVEALHVA